MCVKSPQIYLSEEGLQNPKELNIVCQARENVQVDNGVIESVSLDHNYVCGREYQDIMQLYNNDESNTKKLNSTSQFITEEEYDGIQTWLSDNSEKYGDGTSIFAKFCQELPTQDLMNYYIKYNSNIIKNNHT